MLIKFPQWNFSFNRQGNIQANNQAIFCSSVSKSNRDLCMENHCNDPGTQTIDIATEDKSIKSISSKKSVFEKKRLFFTGVSRSTQSKSYMLSLTECLRFPKECIEVWDTH